ncbi:MAG: hypothetical protein ACYDD4_13510, partial [Acidimicrobiales bacterium]
MPDVRKMKSIRMRALAPLSACAAVVVLAAACSSPASSARTTTTVAPTTSSTPPTSTTTLPSGSPVPSGFQAASVTFVSPTTGYVLGVDSGCAVGGCVALVRTSDTTGSWVSVGAPHAAYLDHGGQATSSGLPVVSEVRFA